MDQSMDGNDIVEESFHESQKEEESCIKTDDPETKPNSLARWFSSFMQFFKWSVLKLNKRPQGKYIE